MAVNPPSLRIKVAKLRETKKPSGAAGHLPLPSGSWPQVGPRVVRAQPRG